MGTVGTSSPLFCSAAEGLARALKAEGHYDRAFEALLQSFQVHAKGDAVHPTPLFEHLDIALDLHKSQPDISLERLGPFIDDAVENLDSRGMGSDGNAGLVMCRAGKVLVNAGGEHNARRAAELLQRGKALVQSSQDAGEANLQHEILQAD